MDEQELHAEIVALCGEVNNTYEALRRVENEVAAALAAGHKIELPEGFDGTHFQWCLARNIFDVAARFSPPAVEPGRRYRAAREALYPTMERALQGLRVGDASMLEYAVAYLEADPWDNHSGYFKQKLMRALRGVPLSETDRLRLRAAILSALTRGRRKEQSETRALARRLDSPAFRLALADLVAETKDEGTRERAGMTLAACRLNDVHHDLRGAVNRSDSSA